MSVIAIKNHRLADTILRAVVIYDDFDSATRATALLERVAARMDGTMRWDIKPWRLNVLKQPALAALTVAVAANADLIVLALKRMHSTPAKLREWLKTWAEHRRIEDAAVLVLPSGKTRAPSAPRDELRAFAKEHGLLLWDGYKLENDGNLELLGRHWQRRELSVALEPSRAFAEELPAAHRWGINE